ncbi:uncharacterized protein LOC108282383 [Cebus imitator]|uniref:uncharacterized protein LOC108282383 n=1 Tax=Cebus imitator TaxID=2715852 RepID=UPI00080A5B07|nr:uncharacterized protein LOC108282383 [Cebus imitator]
MPLKSPIHTLWMTLLSLENLVLEHPGWFGYSSWQLFSLGSCSSPGTCCAPGSGGTAEDGAPALSRPVGAWLGVLWVAWRCGWASCHRAPSGIIACLVPQPFPALFLPLFPWGYPLGPPGLCKLPQGASLPCSPHLTSWRAVEPIQRLFELSGAACLPWHQGYKGWVQPYKSGQALNPRLSQALGWAPKDMLSRLCGDCQHRASRAGLGCEDLRLWKTTLGSCFLFLRVCCGWQLPYSRPVAATQTRAVVRARVDELGLGLCPLLCLFSRPTQASTIRTPSLGFKDQGWGRAGTSLCSNGCGHQLGEPGSGPSSPGSPLLWLLGYHVPTT